MMSSAAYPVEIIPGKPNTVPGSTEKLFGFAPESCSPSARNRVRNPPECCSASSRNRVRLAPDSAATGAVFRRVDDERSGEGISVRCAFWIFDLDCVTESIDFCWDVLAAQRYSEVFETPADDLLDRAVVSRYHEIVHTAPGDPVGISACPECGSRELEYASFSNEKDAYYEATCRECGHRSSS